MTSEPVACVQQVEGRDVLRGRASSWPSRRDLDGVFFRVERDGRGLWHAGLMTEKVEQVCVCMTYSNALVAVINECDKLGVDVYRISVER